MTVATAARSPTRLADYRPPAWRISEVELQFDLDPAATLVHTRLNLYPDPAQVVSDLRLEGCDLQLLSIALDGEPLPNSRYQVDAEGLTVVGLTSACVLQTSVRICPQANTRLEGVYASGPMLLTQCEAQGFRRITYFIDRPDVLAR